MDLMDKRTMIVVLSLLAETQQMISGTEVPKERTSTLWGENGYVVMFQGSKLEQRHIFGAESPEIVVQSHV